MKNKDIKIKDKRKEFDKVLIALQIMVTVFCIIFIIYLFFNQIIDIRHYKERGKNQRSMKNYIMRGSIVDRNGIKLANDKGTYTVYIHQGNYTKDPERPHRIAVKLSPIVGMSVKQVEDKLLLAVKKQSIVMLKRGVDRETVKKIRELHIRELSADPMKERVYPQGTMAAHVLGYYNPYANIATGVEKTAQDKLEFCENTLQAEKKLSGGVIYDFMTDPELTTGPLIGKTVTLTLDSAIQHVCETELQKIIHDRNALRGTIIVMDPRSGEILGYAVYPNYNPNNYRKATQLQLKNWSLTDVYPPGSTFKVLTVASAMELGKINEYTKVEDTGKMKVGSWEITNHDYHKRPYPGWINLESLFEHSSNIGSIKIAQKMTSEEFYTILKKFGIGEKTGIDMPGESKGLLRNYKSWDKSTHYAMGYGYGASVTAMQMVSAIATIANNGVKVTPHVIKYDTQEELEQHVTRTRVMSSENAKKITQILSRSIENSQAPEKLDKYYIAAKTGTSQKHEDGRKGFTKNKLYTSIVGYFPATNPQVLIYVVVDSAQGGGVWGATIAAPVFKEVALQTARILNIPPDKQTKE